MSCSLIEVYTDGATRGNPGPSGLGIAIKENKQLHTYHFFIDNISNHEAEFMAVIKALEICKKNFPGEIISFRTDSKVVVDIVEKNHTKNKAFLPYLEKIQQLIAEFPLFFIKWIPDRENYLADRLAKEALRNS